MDVDNAGHAVTGLVLAGGRGSRMGGIDKGLADVGGRPMVAHVLDRLSTQVEFMVINANRHRDVYAGFGYPVVADAEGDYAGPLAGFAAGLAAAPTPWVVTVPCDSPLLPDDLVERLRATQNESAAEIVSAHDGERLQPVFTLLKTDLLGSLEAFLASGQRKIDRWFAGHRAKIADFSDNKAAFENINRPDDRLRMARQLTLNNPDG